MDKELFNDWLYLLYVIKLIKNPKTSKEILDLIKLNNIKISRGNLKSIETNLKINKLG